MGNNPFNPQMENPFNPKGGRAHAFWQQSGTDSALQGVVADIFKKYPILAKHASDYLVTQGRPMVAGDDRQLETYLPDETWSPVPGKAVTEVYNQDPSQAPNLIAGDMLHHLAQVDPKWAQMKQQVAPPEMEPFRQDEFLMGYLTPDKADNWRNVYTPEQRQKLESMRAYLMGKRW